MTKLWQKNWKLNSTIEKFETETDLLLDQNLLIWDVLGSIGHALGLQKAGILNSEELSILKKGLRDILILDLNNNFNLEYGDEDIHTKIENYLTNTYGSIGKKIHTGRSRNDQVLTCIRLYTKDKLLTIWKQLLDLAYEFMVFSKTHEYELMAGYTHMQRAMPSTVGMWSAALSEGLLDSITLLKTVYKLNNQSPLGSAAGYGTPLNIDRDYTAKLLGFESVQINSLYCQNSRGKIESIVLSSLISILLDINKFATDVLLFSTSEFGFFNIDKELCSGSSIMPQKKNVDVSELLRSKVHIVLGNYSQIVSMSSNLISGYNRDIQDTKKPLFESLSVTSESLNIAKLLLKGIRINQKKIKQSLSSEIFSTHIAFNLVKQGMTFRDAYKQVGNSVSDVNYDNEDVITESKHIGSIGNLGTNLLFKQYVKEQKFFQSEKRKFFIIKNELMKGGE